MLFFGNSKNPHLHFVKDYEKLVKRLRRSHPEDEAMSLAVGGNYEGVGNCEADILSWAGLKNDSSVFDLGCGSGRLASALGKRYPTINYFGTDIVKALLEYAKKKSPEKFKFALNRKLSIPLPDKSVDFCTAFSVFTHLFHAESYIYLCEMKRILKPGGKIVFSFLSPDDEVTWTSFDHEVSRRLIGKSTGHLNMILDRSIINVWKDRLGFENVEYFVGTDSPWGNVTLGQSVAVLS